MRYPKVQVIFASACAGVGVAEQVATASNLVQRLETSYDAQCVQTNCAPQFTACMNEAPQPGTTAPTYCSTILQCIAQTSQSQADGSPHEDPAACTDGLDVANMTPVESQLYTCVQKNHCSSNKAFMVAKETSSVELGISTVDYGCLSKSCSHPVTACQGDAVCAALNECFQVNSSAGDVSQCSKHVSNPNAAQTSLVSCGWGNKCFNSKGTAVNGGASFASQVKPVSFLSLSSMSQAELQAAEQAAEKQEKLAEDEWNKAKAKTNSLLSKVNDEMKALNADLSKTSDEEKADLALLEQSRQKEDAELAKTEAKLKELANTKVTISPPSSFIDTDFLAPLRRAAQQAREFAKQVKARALNFKLNAGRSSFLQGDGSSEQDKASESLKKAEEALQKLNEDIASQKKQLNEEEDSIKKEEVAAERAEQAPVAAVASSDLEAETAASFVQTGIAKYDPLSPQALADWRDKFELQLQKAREAAGIKTPFRSSLMQMPLTSSSFIDNDQLAEDKRQVERLQSLYDSQMAKLQQDNAALMADAREQVEKAKDLQARLQSDSARASLLQTQSMNKYKYNAAAEQEHIEELRRKWEREAQSIQISPQMKEEDAELQALIEQQKNKEQAAEAQLEGLKLKLQKDIEAMNHDIALNSAGNRYSLMQSRSRSDSDVKPVVVPEVTSLAAKPETEAAKPETDASVAPSFVQVAASKSVDPAQMALQKAESDLLKLKQQLRDETAKLNSMHFGLGH